MREAKRIDQNSSLLQNECSVDMNDKINGIDVNSNNNDQK